MQYCSLQHWTLRLHSHMHNSVLFLLCLHPFILSGVISPLISSSLWGTYWPGEFLFQCPIILPFHTVHGLLKARILKWLAIPFSSGPHSVRPLHLDPPILGGPTWHHLVSLSSTRLWSSVIRLTGFLWVWLQCVCPLMPSCNTYHLTWVSLTLGLGYPFMNAPAKSSHCSLPWMKGGFQVEFSKGHLVF